jgi:hypothetical protein
LLLLLGLGPLASPLLPPQKSKSNQKSTENCKVHKGTLWYIKNDKILNFDKYKEPDSDRVLYSEFMDPDQGVNLITNHLDPAPASGPATLTAKP